MKFISKLKIPNYVRLVAFFGIIFTLALRLLGSFIDPDMWWHVRLGADILNGKWVNSLTYTCTDYTWVNHSWLSDVLITVINNFFGFYGLSIFFALVFFAGISFSFLTLKEILKHSGVKNSKFSALLYIVFFTLLLSSFIAIRPQVFTFLFFNALIYLLFRIYYSKQVKYIYLLPFTAIFILWVNLHGGFVIGIALIGVFLVDTFFNFLRCTFKRDSQEARLLFKKVKFLTLLIIVFALSSLINPFGLDLWKEIFTLVLGSNNAQFITEWRAINIKDYYNLFYFLLFIGALVLQIINKKRSSIRLLMLIAFGLLSFYSVRYILPVSGIILLVTFVEGNIQIDWLLKSILKDDKDLLRLLAILKYAVIVVIAFVAGIGAFIGVTFFQSLGDLNVAYNHILYPIEAKKYLEENKEEFKDLYFYNTYVWGGYLEYSLPEFNWIIDGRMPEWQCKGLVKKDIMLDYIEVEDLGKQWKTVLNKYNIKVLLIRTDGVLSNIVSADVEWQAVYTDMTATIFVRK